MTVAAGFDIARAVAVFHALSDETRLEIMTDALDAAQSRLSFHLKTLKDAGIVTDRKVGRWVYYTLDRDAFGELEEIVKSIKPSKRLSVSTCCS